MIDPRDRNSRQRWHMIIEPAMLVIGDHEQGFAPERPLDQGIQDRADEMLPARDIRRRAVIKAGREIDEIGIDERDGRQVSRLGTGDEIGRVLARERDSNRRSPQKDNDVILTISLDGVRR
jgi:hypothetical protein